MQASPRFLRRLRRRWPFFLAGAIGLVVCLCAAAGFGRFIGPPPVATVEVGRGLFRREVRARGLLKAVKATPILVPMDIESAQKVAWIAKDGGAVKAGDPIVVFDPSDAERMLADGRADQETAQNRIVKTRAESRRTSGSLAIDRDLARDEKNRAEQMAARDTEIFSRNEILESEIDRKLLDKRSSAADVKLGANEKLASADLSLAEIERSKAELRIRVAEKGLGSLRITAPHDGLFVLERSWRGTTLSVGETVWPGQKIAEIPDLESLEAKVYVLEADAGGLDPGRTARVTVEGRAGDEIPAKVSRVDAIAKPHEWRSPIKYFETILSFDATGLPDLKPGQLVEARIVLEDKPDAVAVPRGAIFEKDGKRVVYRWRGGRFEPVEVTVGHHSLSRVVIEKGLEAGDRIALRDPSRAAAEIFSAPQTAGSGAGAAGAATP